MTEMGIRSTLTAIGIGVATALAVTFVFLAAAMIRGAYTPVDLLIGSVWFFSISLIVSMPLFIPRLKRKLNKAS